MRASDVKLNFKENVEVILKSIYRLTPVWFIISRGFILISVIYGFQYLIEIPWYAALGLATITLFAFEVVVRIILKDIIDTVKDRFNCIYEQELYNKQKQVAENIDKHLTSKK